MRNKSRATRDNYGTFTGDEKNEEMETLFTHRGEILTAKNKGDFKEVVNILSPAAYNRENSFENPQAERCRRI